MIRGLAEQRNWARFGVDLGVAKNSEVKFVEDLAEQLHVGFKIVRTCRIANPTLLRESAKKWINGALDQGTAGPKELQMETPSHRAPASK